MSIWVIKEGRREGPYDEQDVRELVYEGTYTDADPAIRDGQFNWTTLGDLLGRPPPPQPPPIPAAVPEPPPLPPEAAPAHSIPEAAPLPATLPALENPEPPPAPARPIPVTVIDFQMPFGSMVMLMLKWAFAAIPALLILLIIGALFWSAIFAILAAALGPALGR